VVRKKGLGESHEVVEEKKGKKSMIFEKRGLGWGRGDKDDRGRGGAVGKKRRGKRVDRRAGMGGRAEVEAKGKKDPDGGEHEGGRTLTAQRQQGP